MSKALLAQAAVTIHAPASRIWEAITNPESIKQYLFGADVSTDWKEGSPISYTGIYQGKVYQDQGIVLKVEPEKLLLITHWSPLSGSSNSPENYHLVRYDLAAENGNTHLIITQDNNASEEEQQQNSNFWKTVLDGLKKLLEGEGEQNKR